jgi:hypothetical protein
VSVRTSEQQKLSSSDFYVHGIRDKGTHHSHRIRPCIEYGLSAVGSYSANSYERDLLNGSSDLAQARQSNNIRRVSLRASGEYWSHRQIVDWKFRCLLSLLQIVSGETDDHFAPQNAPCSFGGQVSLSQVNAVGSDRQGDIDAIVD